MEKKEIFDSLLSVIFDELQLKAAYRELIRKLVEASKGEKQFDLSLTELGDLLYGLRTLDERGRRNKAKYSLKSFQKWQVENKVCLVKVAKKGKRKQKADGTFTFEKTKYNFALLDELKKASRQSEGSGLRERADGVLNNLRSRRAPTKKKDYHPNHQIKKAKKTILTFFRKIYGFALKTEKDPLEECLKVIRLAEKEVAGIHNKRISSQKQEEFISSFEETLKIEPVGKIPLL